MPPIRHLVIRASFDIPSFIIRHWLRGLCVSVVSFPQESRMAKSIRSFLAVETPPGVRSSACRLIEQLRAAQAQVKWVAPENLHLTLKFLGDVREDDVAKVAEAAREAAATCAAFDLEIRGAGAFPNVNRPRTIWLGGGEGDAAMARLAAALDKALRPLGFPEEDRPYSTHLTIGRIRNPSPQLRDLGERLRQQADFAAGRTNVAEVVLFSSDLTQTGPIYTALARLPLAAQ
jgi:2'-5' RNA ligase